MVSVEYYRDNGYLPEALLNFLAFLGWNPGGTEEIFSLEQLISKFDIHKVQKAGAIFNPEKLKWYNREYITKLSNQDFDKRAETFVPDWVKAKSGLYDRCRSIIREKISTFGEIGKMFEVGGDLAFVKELPQYNPEMLLWKKSPDREEAKKHLLYIKQVLSGISEDDFIVEKIKSAIWSYAEEHGRGNVLWPFRVAITGLEKSPDPFVSSYLVCKETSLKRIDIALSHLG
jgi:glutamyl/glutaminyl-tRNA synthetase